VFQKCREESEEAARGEFQRYKVTISQVSRTQSPLPSQELVWCSFLCFIPFLVPQKLTESLPSHQRSTMSQCCLQGFEWDGTPNGKESTLANNKAYVTGSNPDVAIMVIADLFGWTFINERLLSDHYAKEADATVFMPDL
jgi:hypothetical protein